MAREEYDETHVSKEYACLRARPELLWMPYFDWLSKTPHLRHEALICSYGVDPEKIVLNIEWLMETPLALPEDIQKQQTYASILDGHQAEIKLLEKKCTQLAKQKRGLMQRLLDGEWRVPARDKDVEELAHRALVEAAE